MKMTFRLECPQCHWGHEFSNDYINMGYLKGKCAHCENEFYFKVTVMGVNIEISQNLPDNVPCMTLAEVKDDCCK